MLGEGVGEKSEVVVKCFNAALHSRSRRGGAVSSSSGAQGDGAGMLPLHRLDLEEHLT